jgi:hypothetical protein
MAVWDAPIDVEGGEPKVPAVTVFEEGARDTGLLDGDGNAIMVTERDVIGFVRFEGER